LISTSSSVSVALGSWRHQLRIEVDEGSVATVVAERLHKALERGGVLGLATGRTMEPVYASLRSRLCALPAPERAAVRARWRSFNLDEYVGLGPQQRESFAAFMHAQLGRPLGLDSRCLQLPDGQAADPELEAQRYATVLQSAGGLQLQLLGLGSNGHVGFNEPPCSAVAPCRCVELTSATRLQNAVAFGGDPAAVPARAITLGMAEILAARQLLLVVTGAAKAEILRRALLEPPCPEVPASWLQRHPCLEIVVDQAAAALLEIS